MLRQLGLGSVFHLPPEFQGLKQIKQSGKICTNDVKYLFEHRINGSEAALMVCLSFIFSVELKAHLRASNYFMFLSLFHLY